MIQLANQENSDVSGVPAYHAVYEQNLPAVMAVPKEDYIPITVDIRKVVTNTLGALPKIQALADELKELAELGKFDQSALDNLPAYLYTMAHAQALYQVATDESAVSEHADMAIQVREVVLADARALAKRNLINGDSLNELRGGQGYVDIAFDLLSIVATLRAAWSNIQGRTALSLEELDRAEMLAQHLLAAVGVRKQGPLNPADTSVIRQAAFTLFVNTYDEVRRGVNFVRWHEGDADEIAPSIYAGRRRRSRTESVATTGTDVPTQVDVNEPIDLSHLPPADTLPELPSASATNVEEG